LSGHSQCSGPSRWVPPRKPSYTHIPTNRYKAYTHGTHAECAYCSRGQVRTIKLDHSEAAGPCWARHLAQVNPLQLLERSRRFMVASGKYCDAPVRDVSYRVHCAIYFRLCGAARITSFRSTATCASARTGTLTSFRPSPHALPRSRS
jgi:hypothetical protein